MSTTVYVGKVYEQTTLNGIVKDVSHIYAGNRLVASIEAVAGISTIKYMHGDHLGSISVITDANGAVLERLRFDVFGAPVDPATGAALAGFGSTNTNRGYTGHEMDASTGLINMNARLYDPVLGRFISADAIIPNPGNMQEFNRYSYVTNNPLVYTDPTGHWSWGGFWKSVRQVAVAAVVIAAAAMTYGAVSGFLASYVGSGFLGSVVTGAVAGGAAGFVGGIAGATFAGANASQIWQAGLAGGRMGAIAGAIAGGVSWAGGQYHVEEVIYKMAGVGLGSAANGGNMERNVQAMLFAGIGYSAHKLWNTLTPDKDRNGNTIRMTGGPRGGVLGEAGTKTSSTDPYQTRNDFGTYVETPPSPSEWRFYFSLQEGSLASRLANLVPGLSDVSVLHDAFQNNYPDGFYRTWVVNVPNMLPAAAITYVAYLDMAPTSVVMDQIK